LYVKDSGPLKGHSTGVASTRNMEYSNASPVMREHRLCKLSRAWQKAGTYTGDSEVESIAEE
jgi:hypothetical protein